MRTIITLLLLVGTAAAADPDPNAGAWKLISQGQGVRGNNLIGTGTGNALNMEVEAGAATTYVNAAAHSGLLEGTQEGSRASQATSYLTLVFAGSPNSTKHEWSIESLLNGNGVGDVDIDLVASGWGDSMQLIEITGDLTHRASGLIGVDDGVGVKFSLSVPLNFQTTIVPRVRQQGHDVFNVYDSKGSHGVGKACRIRIASYAKAHVRASGGTGFANTAILGWLRGDIRMTGTCVVPDGTRVKDRFQLDDTPGQPWKNEVTPPLGGLEHASGIPPEKPTDEERSGEEKEPAVDAKDHEDSKSTPSDPEEEPADDPAADDPAADDPETGDSTSGDSTTDSTGENEENPVK